MAAMPGPVTAMVDGRWVISTAPWTGETLVEDSGKPAFRCQPYPVIFPQTQKLADERVTPLH
jgi:hypothetical protein